MSYADQIRKGMVIQHDGQPYVVLDHVRTQTGKQKATVHVKLRSLTSGHASDRTLDELGKIDEIAAENRHMQFLYAAADERIFMDAESFEQFSLDKDMLDSAVDFLVEGESYKFLTIDGRPASIQIPPAVTLEVVDTAPVEHAGGSSNVTKEAALNSGVTVRVPLFIKTGDRIRVGTDDCQYQCKEH